MTEIETHKVPEFKSIAPQMVVPDVVNAAEHNRDTLGFEILGYFLDPPVFAMVKRDGVIIQFGRGDSGGARPNCEIRRDGLDAYIWVDDIDGLFVELTGRGAHILEGPVARSYGWMEIIVEDCFGHRLAFGA